MAKIEDHKYTVEEAFRECFYIVPDYQREYVWTEKEVDQLLQDIDEEFDVGDRREYFIGTVLVSPTQQKNHFEVIDGQQRLTDVSFTARPGTLTAVIGPSPPHNADLLGLLAGTRRPTSGTVTVDEHDVHAEPELTRTRIGIVSGDDRAHPNLTVERALGYAARLRLPPKPSASPRSIRVFVAGLICANTNLRRNGTIVEQGVAVTSAPSE